MVLEHTVSVPGPGLEPTVMPGVTWSRSQIEDDFSEEFWILLHQYPSDWDRHHDVVTWHIPDLECTWLALRYPQEWAGAEIWS
jgi:hypothetical protein